MIPQVMAMHRTCQLALSAHLVESVSPTARWTQRARQRSHLSQTLHHLFARSPPACSGTWCCQGLHRRPRRKAATRTPHRGPLVVRLPQVPLGAMAGSSYFQKTLKGDGGHIRTLAMHRLCTGYAQASHDSSPARKASHDSSPARRLSDGGHIHTPFVRVVRLPRGQWV